MQMVKRIVGGFFLSLLLLWLLAPKQELYYLLEKSLKDKNVVISNETVTDTWFGLKIENADIYVNEIKMAEAAKLNFNFFFFYNQLKVNSITMDKSLENMAPSSIDSLKATYSLIDPLNIKLEGEGSFGVIDGKVSLLDRKVEILFPVKKELKTIKKFLRNDETRGWYYETNY